MHRAITHPGPVPFYPIDDIPNWTLFVGKETLRNEKHCWIWIAERCTLAKSDSQLFCYNCWLCYINFCPGGLTVSYFSPVFPNQWRHFTIGNTHCAAARLLLGEFLELQARRAGEACRPSMWCDKHAQQCGPLATWPWADLFMFIILYDIIINIDCIHDETVLWWFVISCH